MRSFGSRVVSETPQDVHLLYIREKLDAIHEQTTKTNGRMNAAERDIAVLQWAYALGVPVIAWIVYRIA